MATDYSRRYVPPMPVLMIRLSAPEVAPLGRSIVAVVDTGADVCLVPRVVLASLELSVGEPVLIRGQWGEPVAATRYPVDLHFEHGVMPAVDVVSDPDGREVILGRNVLNKLRLLLDGPEQSTAVLTGKSRL